MKLRMWFWTNFCSYRYLFPILVLLYKNVSCDPIANNKLNASLRHYFTDEEAVIRNQTEVKPLQNPEDYIPKKRIFYNNKLVRFQQEVPDNALSSSSYSRGFHRGDYPIGSYGYDYEVAPYDGVHGHYDHHHQQHYAHHVEPYHKHHDHALVAKALLWPLAGLALLGAAATFVTNPVLLQLGVVTGRRRRSVNYKGSTTSATELLVENWDSFGNSTTHTEEADESLKIRKLNILNRDSKKKTSRKTKHLITTTPKSSQMTLDIPPEYNYYWNNHRYVPIPLIMKKNN